jgi:hypothetical protein
MDPTPISLTYTFISFIRIRGKLTILGFKMVVYLVA